jgi:hypothetical protein
MTYKDMTIYYLPACKVIFLLFIIPVNKPTLVFTEPNVETKSHETHSETWVLQTGLSLATLW